MTKEEMKAIEYAVKKAFETTDYYIERQQHYDDHQFIYCLRKWSEDIKNTTLKTIVRILVMAIIGMIVGGFIFWGKNHIK